MTYMEHHRRRVQDKFTFFVEQKTISNRHSGLERVADARIDIILIAKRLGRIC